MSWFKKSPEPAKPATNRVEDLANKLHQERRGHEIESSLSKFDYKSLTERERESWHHLMGIEAMGFQTMQLAALLADAENDFSTAEQSILAVQFKQNDFPWLEDVRTVLLAKLNHRHRRQEEEKFKQQFLQKQKLLFEPDHAVSFCLLEYQELLKQDYQKGKNVSR